MSILDTSGTTLFKVAFHRPVLQPGARGGHRTEVWIKAEDHAAAHNIALDIPGVTYENIASVQASHDIGKGDRS